ncbi:MAG TPA: hypothetical protein VFX96_09530 [Pyrinomonadaceae bacterium]|nr:hypothetical protein [Pyrinomonadaceae bacterium]
MPPTSLFRRIVSARGLNALTIIVLLAAQPLPRVAGQPQTGPPPGAGRGGDRVLIQTDSGSIVTASAEPAAPETAVALQTLLSKYPGTWKVDIARGLVKRLRPVTDIEFAASPKEFSSELLSEFAGLFGVTPEELTYLTDYNLKERQVVEHRQTVNGVPVEHSFLIVSTIGGKLEQVTSRVYERAKEAVPSTTPALGAQEAADAATSDLRAQSVNVDGLELTYESEQRILPEGETFTLTWKITVNASKALFSYTYYIDAATGRVVKSYSNIQSQQKGAPAQGEKEVRQAASATLKTEALTAAPGRFAGSEGKPGVAAADAGAIPPPQPASGWEFILSDNFDVLAFPYSPWRVFDNNGATGGELFWDDQNCVFNDPSWSLWAASGGFNRLNACTSNYVDNMDSWVVYGPFSLSNASDGLFDFHYRNDSELNFDYFKWMVSTNGTNFHGFQVSGSSNGWQYQSIDFKNVPTLGNILGSQNVWIAFNFTSDGSIVPGKGAFVDDVAVKKFVNTACAGVRGRAGGHIYGRNHNELVLRSFKNMKVVLDNTLAFDTHTVTDSLGNYASSACSDRVRFELEGFSTRNFVKVRDCDGGGCLLGGNTLRSPDFSFASVINFDWNEDEDDKKEVNVFWHINDMHDWFRDLIGQDLMNYQMQAYVDYADSSVCAPGSLNAFYNGGNDNIFFCPTGGVARESDWIYHEYTHGIIDHIANYGLPNVDETGALNEGLADYFAGAKNNDATWSDGIPEAQRRMTDVVNYQNKCFPELSACSPGQYRLRWTAPSGSNDNGYVHDNSLVPSGALWNLRQNRGLSASFVDKLVIETLILEKPLSFVELLDGLVAQDSAHQSQIRAAFATRGVGQTTPTNIQVTVRTSPAGRSFVVDGTTYTAARTFTWAAGSSHTIAVPSPQSAGTGARYLWSGWSDGGALSHVVAPSAATTYTANFVTQYLLTTSAGLGGSVSPLSGWYNGGQLVSIQANPSAGFVFSGWSGTGLGSFTGTNNPAFITMGGPITQAASFRQQGGTGFSLGGSVTKGTALTPLGGVTVRITSPLAGFVPRDATSSPTNGSYLFGSLPTGRPYVVTPISHIFNFSPASRTVSSLNFNLGGQNFSAVSRKTYSIRGFVTKGAALSPLGGVSMRLTSAEAGFTPLTVTSAADGSYTFAAVPAGLPYVVTPVSAVFNFTPGARSVSTLISNVTGQNFNAATRRSYSISGRVLRTGTTTGVGGVTMSLIDATTGALVRSVVTLADGTYVLSGVPAGLNYVVRPSRPGAAFSPASRGYVNLSANQLGQHFTTP